MPPPIHASILVRTSTSRVISVDPSSANFENVNGDLQPVAGLARFISPPGTTNSIWWDYLKKHGAITSDKTYDRTRWHERVIPGWIAGLVDWVERTQSWGPRLVLLKRAVRGAKRDPDFLAAADVAWRVGGTQGVAAFVEAYDFTRRPA